MLRRWHDMTWCHDRPHTWHESTWHHHHVILSCHPLTLAHVTPRAGSGFYNANWLLCSSERNSAVEIYIRPLRVKYTLVTFSYCNNTFSVNTTMKNIDFHTASSIFPVEKVWTGCCWFVSCSCLSSLRWSLACDDDSSFSVVTRNTSQHNTVTALFSLLCQLFFIIQNYVPTTSSAEQQFSTAHHPPDPEWSQIWFSPGSLLADTALFYVNLDYVTFTTEPALQYKFQYEHWGEFISPCQ